MSRVLVLLPSSSYRSADFVAAASALGVDLVVASEEDPPLDLGDRFLRIDCRDPVAASAAIVDFADRSPLDAVVAADDAGVVTAALATQALGLPGHTPQSAAATRDKLAMRRLLAAREVPQPDFEPLDHAGQIPALSFPLVLKPRTGAASRGVLRVDSASELSDAYRRVRAIADDLGESGPLLAESFVPGAEVALEGLVTAGELTVLAIFDKPSAPQGPTFPETLLVTPSTQPPLALAELERITSEAVAALGLAEGPIHSEARIDGDGRVHLLEIAARSIGGLCGRSLRFGLMGSSLEELILAAALGAKPTTARQPRASGVLMVPVETGGVLVEVAGVEAARAIDGVTEIDIAVPGGTRIQPLPEGDRYLGFVFAVGPDPDEVSRRLRKAAGFLEPIVEPAG